MPILSNAATSGLTIVRPTCRSNLNLRSALRESTAAIVGTFQSESVTDDNRMITQIQESATKSLVRASGPPVGDVGVFGARVIRSSNRGGRAHQDAVGVTES